MWPTDTKNEENEEVSKSTTEALHTEKSGLWSWGVTELGGEGAGGWQKMNYEYAESSLAGFLGRL